MLHSRIANKFIKLVKLHKCVAVQQHIHSCCMLSFKMHLEALTHICDIANQLLLHLLCIASYLPSALCCSCGVAHVALWYMSAADLKVHLAALTQKSLHVSALCFLPQQWGPARCIVISIITSDNNQNISQSELPCGSSQSSSGCCRHDRCFCMHLCC